MWPPLYYLQIYVAQPVKTLMVDYNNNRAKRRKRIFGKGGKALRNWDK